MKVYLVACSVVLVCLFTRSLPATITPPHELLVYCMHACIHLNVSFVAHVYRFYVYLS